MVCFVGYLSSAWVGGLFMLYCRCAPYTDGRPDGVNICEKVYPPSPTPYRWLNSGVWMARARTARRALQAALAYGVKMQEDVYPLLGGQIPGTEWPVVPISKQNDQEMFAQIFLDGNLENVTLDYHCSLIQCMHQSEGDVDMNTRNSKGKPTPRNQITGSHPVLFHFNGGSKGSFASVDGLFGSEAKIDGNTRVYKEGGRTWLPYKEVCSAYPDLWT